MDKKDIIYPGKMVCKIEFLRGRKDDESRASTFAKRDKSPENERSLY